jgi:hypothetical protein
MPRVNRDLQRRMAARRERERRRPTERRYQFAPTDEAAAAAPQTEAIDGAPYDQAEVLDSPAGEATPAPVSRTTPTTPSSPRAARGSVARPAPRPFSAYREEYHYVIGDLRRIVVVIGSLLVLLIILSFVLPR